MVVIIIHGHALKVFLRAKKKLKYLTDDPPSDDKKSEDWWSENSW
jgi:hypothetical protein